MHRTVHRVGTVGAALAVLLLSMATSAGARPSIVVLSPRPYQVLQRGANGRGAMDVNGIRRGFAGRVEVRWGTGAWHAVSCGGDGSFRVRLGGLSAGEGALVVRSARHHAIRCERTPVGVGDIYVVAGQSNASGRSSSRFSGSIAGLTATVFGNDYRWKPLRDPTDSPLGQVDVVSRDSYAGGSVWPLVAKELMRKEPVPVAFVPCAKGTTSIAMWQRDDRTPARSDTLYGSMLRRVRAVGGHIRAVLFWQGENNARNRTSHDSYEASLLHFAADVRGDVGVPIVVAQMGDYRHEWYTAASVDAIRLAQQDAWGTSNVVAGPVLYDVDLHGDVHFRRASDMVVAARRWAATIRSGILHRESATSPRLIGATYDGALTITIAADVGASSLAPGAVGGIVVRCQGVTVPLVGAIAGPTSITLTLSKPAAGPLTITLGSGRSAAGSQVPVEASAWQLPMIMFVDRAVADPVGATVSPAPG